MRNGFDGTMPMLPEKEVVMALAVKHPCDLHPNRS